MMKFKIDILPICFVLFVVIVAGCVKTAAETAPVTGHITLDGKPLGKADVLFQPGGSKPPSSGRTDANGRYELAYKRGVMGGMIGTNTVQITISSDVVENPPHIPAQYNSESKLIKEVKSGPNEFNFDLVTNENEKVKEREKDPKVE